MKEMFFKYSGLIMFYAVIVGGVFLINYRFSKINNDEYQQIAYLENK